MMNQELQSHDLNHALIRLGIGFRELAQENHPIKKEASRLNPWFNEKNLDKALLAWAECLIPDKITRWLESYPRLLSQWDSRIQEPEKIETIGLIMAGNIPLVGFHDLLSCLVSGNRVQVKLSSQDSALIPFITQKFLETSPIFQGKTQFTERIQNMDRIIATGSNNSSRYFEYYFGKYPHIIRKNRHSLAILTGKESKDEILELGKDIFLYFGMGCRNVSKLMVPRGYNFVNLLDILESFREDLAFNKYLNNVQYQNALLQLQGVHFYQNGFLYLKEDPGISSPISIIYYEYFEPDTLIQNLEALKEEIQCMVGNSDLLEELGINVNLLPQKLLNFGKTQKPELWDYADHVDTLQFLLEF